MTEASLFTFPCAFPIKLIARSGVDLESIAREIVRAQALHPDQAHWSVHASRHGRFQALTVTIQADGRDELDRLYGAFTGRKEILIVL